jgi:hypothetical protein
MSSHYLEQKIDIRFYYFTQKHVSCSISFEISEQLSISCFFHQLKEHGTLFIKSFPSF